MQTVRSFAVSIILLSIFTQATPALTEPTSSTEIPVEQSPYQLFSTPDYNGQILDRSYLLGSLNGSRQELANKGITLDANLTQVTQGVVSGGVQEDWDYSGRGEATLNLDTAKMGLWPGGLFTLMGEGNFGNSLSKETGSLLGVNANDLLPETDNSFVLPNFTYTQFLSPNFGLAVGKFATITSTTGDMNEFAHGKGAENFMNPALNFNPVTALTIPYSTLGLSGIFLPTKDLSITTSVLDSHGEPDSSGLDDGFSDGATLAVEGRQKTDFFNKTGHQLLGATYSTSDYTDLDQRAANLIFPDLPIKEANESWSIFWNADQYFYQPDPNQDRGVGVFARLGVSDGEANPIENFASFGLGGRGIIPCREQDGFGLGYFYGWIADNQITNDAGFGDAQGIEAYYAIALTPALILTPDLQWIEPSQKRVDSSWVAGARLFAAF